MRLLGAGISMSRWLVPAIYSNPSGLTVGPFCLNKSAIG